MNNILKEVFKILKRTLRIFQEVQKEFGERGSRNLSDLECIRNVVVVNELISSNSVTTVSVCVCE